MSMIQDFFNFALPVLDNVPFIRGILGFILVFFLPGFAWTFIFFEKANRLERIVLSFGLSIALVTLSVLFTNVVFGIRITGLHSLITVLVVTAVPLATYFIRKWIRRKRRAGKTEISDDSEQIETELK